MVRDDLMVRSDLKVTSHLMATSHIMVMSHLMDGIELSELTIVRGHRTVDRVTVC